MNKKMTDEQRRAMFAKQGGKSYRRNYDDKPTFFTKHSVSSDIKNMHRKNPDEYHGNEVDLYKRRLALEADKKHIKESKRSNKIQKKLIKKQEKEAQKNVEESYAEDQKQESSERQEIQDTGGG